MKKVLNLYSGLGGNRKLWQGVQVTSVEMNTKIANVYGQKFPQDTLLLEDAHQYLLEHVDEFDFIWSSPPCQSHSKMMRATRHKRRQYPDMTLYQEIIFLQNFFKGKWVVENVQPYYESLIIPTFKSGRHYFWSNFSISPIEIPPIKGFINLGTVEGANKLKDWLGIHYDGNIYYEGNHCPGQVLRNCVHPLLGKHVFESSMIQKLSTS